MTHKWTLPDQCWVMPVSGWSLEDLAHSDIVGYLRDMREIRIRERQLEEEADGYHWTPVVEEDT